jgi:hypothetical protein
MDQKIVKAKQIIEENLLEKHGFDSENYKKNITSINFHKIILYGGRNVKNKKLSRTNDFRKYKLLRHIPKKDKTINKETDSYAYYKIKENYITYYKDKTNPMVLVHEMIHMSSRKSKQKLGLAKVHKKGYIVLNELNEGFTQFLTILSMGKDDVDNKFYSLQTRIAKLIHLAVGDEIINIFSKGDVRKLTGFYANEKTSSPIKKISYGLEELELIYYYTSTYVCNLTIDNESQLKNVKRNITRIMEQQKNILDTIQRYIIDLYFQNEENLNNDDKLMYFMESLITDEVDSDHIYNRLTMFGNSIGDDAMKYLDNKLKRIYDKKGHLKTLR